MLPLGFLSWLLAQLPHRLIFRPELLLEGNRADQVDPRFEADHGKPAR